MSPGLKTLRERVLDSGQCTLCGACAGLCPYLVFANGRVVALHECAVEDGRCHHYCPRIELDPAALCADRQAGVEARRLLDLGPVASIQQARARDTQIRAAGQSGGVVTALMTAALSSGLVQAVLLSERPHGVGARGRLARTPAEVLAGAGSGYAAGPALATLHAATEDSLAVVALPCQVQALARMRTAPEPLTSPAASRVRLVVGLFCSLAFDERRLAERLAPHGFAGAGLRSQITPPPNARLDLTRDGRSLSVPLADLADCVRPACRSCFDLTAELADLSVGTVEGVPGWSVLVVRSAAGAELLARAGTDLEVAPLPDGYLDKLVSASRQKKRRALERGAGAYLRLTPELCRELGPEVP